MPNYDIIIIGAGLSGIDAACHFKMKCPNKTFTIFEGRENIGGTWDLFKYPGIRSDSDMHTFSYSFKPWTYPKSISDGETIMEYLHETVQEYKIEEHIQFQHFITKANWSSKNNQWTLRGRNLATGEEIEASCNFLMICTGYYDYEEGYTPDFKGVDSFQGEFVHPQKWTADIDYTNKKVVVIGSGATAVTLIPAMVDKTHHITMLQRSPSYILSRPLYDGFSKFVHRVFPKKTAHFLARWKSILEQIYLYSISRRKPEAVKAYIEGKAKEVLGEEYDIDPHFNPSYNPWEQRLCAIPDNDLFHAIKEEKCTVVTDHIDTFFEKGIRLTSGKELEADLVVSATGLKIKIMGGMEVSIDNQKIDPSKLLTYKGIMLQDIPNAAIITGYTNASWTLKADLVCAYICRLINHMDAKGLKSCVPRLSEQSMEQEPIIDFSSGYVMRALDVLPKQGDRYPWKLYQNYIRDMIVLKYKKLDQGTLEFGK
ncbi:MAG: NAD(P)/FAD-dependent oxidoreductase [Bacteroidota bacterium]